MNGKKTSTGTWVPSGTYSPSPTARKIVAGQDASSRGAAVAAPDAPYKKPHNMTAGNMGKSK